MRDKRGLASTFKKLLDIKLHDAKFNCSDHGNRNIWKISLVRFDTRATLAEKAPPVISTDYFASRPENVVEGSFFDHQW